MKHTAKAFAPKSDTRVAQANNLVSPALVTSVCFAGLFRHWYPSVLLAQHRLACAANFLLRCV